jgi:hypothetical protein
VIAHIVLFRPRTDLSSADAALLIDAFNRAVSLIPAVRAARVGPRLSVGAEYERLPQPDFGYVAVIEFDDLAGLRSYLEHPAHVEIGRRFWEASEEQQVYDFEIAGSLDAGAATRDF